MLKLILFFISISIFQLASAEENPALISVNAIAEKSIDPNMVILNIESYGKSGQAKMAQDLQAKEYQKIKNAVDKYKIKKEDFTTENFSMNPEYTYDQKTQSNRITGYRVSHSIKVILRKVDDAGEFVDTLGTSAKPETSGISVQSIQWDSDKKAQAESVAMTEAVKLAQQKAESLAKASGVKIKRVFHVAHMSGSEGVVRSPLLGRAKAMSFASESMADSSTTLSGGQIKVRTEVNMQFEIQ